MCGELHFLPVIFATPVFDAILNIKLELDARCTRPVCTRCALSHTQLLMLRAKHTHTQTTALLPHVLLLPHSTCYVNEKWCVCVRKCVTFAVHVRACAQDWSVHDNNVCTTLNTFTCVYLSGVCTDIYTLIRHGGLGGVFLGLSVEALEGRREVKVCVFVCVHEQLWNKDMLILIWELRVQRMRLRLWASKLWLLNV